MGNELTQYEVEKDQGLRRDDGSLNLKNLKQIHLEAIALLLAGATQTVIADTLNKTNATISRWFSDPLVLGELERYRSFEDLRLQSMFSKVVDTVEAGLDDKNIHTQFKAVDRFVKLNEKAHGGEGITTDTAEDVIARMLNLNIQVNVGGAK